MSEAKSMLEIAAKASDVLDRETIGRISAEIAQAMRQRVVS